MSSSFNYLDEQIKSHKIKSDIFMPSRIFNPYNIFL